MENLKSKDWWKAAGIRALKTFFQTFVSTIGVATAIQDVNWVMVLSASTLAAILSIATSFAGLPEVNQNNEEGGDK
jgi:hypothetical protein